MGKVTTIVTTVGIVYHININNKETVKILNIDSHCPYLLWIYPIENVHCLSTEGGDTGSGRWEIGGNKCGRWEIRDLKK